MPHPQSGDRLTREWVAKRASWAQNRKVHYAITTEYNPTNFPGRVKEKKKKKLLVSSTKKRLVISD